MTDIYLANKLLFEKDKEPYGQVEERTINVLGAVVSIAFFAWAFYLSWTCNNKCFPNIIGDIERFVRAFVAGSFSLLYIILHYVFFSVECASCV